MVQVFAGENIFVDILNLMVLLCLGIVAQDNVRDVLLINFNIKRYVKVKFEGGQVGR